jgi:HEAT repeat protein
MFGLTLRVPAQPSDAEIRSLIKALDDKDDLVRRQAMEKIGKSRRAIKAAHPVLIELAKKDKDLRGDAVRALGHCSIHAKAAIPVLLEALNDEEIFAIGALGRLGPAASDAIPALTKAFKKREFPLTDRILEALAEIGPKSLPFLMSLFKDDKHGARAIYVLAEMGADAKPCVPLLIDLLKNSKHSRSRDAAAYALGTIGPDAKTAVPALREALKDEELAWRAIRSLGQIGPDAKPAFPALLDFLSAERHTAETLHSLHQIDSSQDMAIRQGLSKRIGSLIKRVELRHEVEAGRAADELGKLGHYARAAIPVLTAALKDPLPGTRVAAAKAIARIDPDNRAPIATLKADLKGRDRDVTHAAARAVALFGPLGKPCVPELLDLLKDEKDVGRWIYADALGGIGPAAAEAVPALIPRLKETDETIQVYVARALGKIGDKRAAPAMRRAFQEATKSVKVEMGFPLCELDPGSPGCAQACQIMVDFLLAMLDQTDVHPLQQFMAYLTLAQLGPKAKGAVPFLTDELSGPRGFLPAVLLLAIQPDHEAARRLLATKIRPLIELLRDPGPKGLRPPQLQILAAKVLGYLGAGAVEALPALQVACRHRNPAIRDAAAAAIQQIKASPER